MAKGTKTGGGSRAGIPNKVTTDARAAIATFVDGNSHRLQEWLDAVASGVQDSKGNYVVEPNPEKAFSLFQSVIEYHVPKLARSEITGDGGGPVKVEEVRRVIVDPKETTNADC